MSFESELKKFAEKTDARLNLAVRKIVFDVSSRLVLRSPVGDAKYWISKPPGYVGGRFRGNWQYGLDNINSTVTDTVDSGGGATVGKIQAAVAAKAAGHIHYITNSLPYAIRLEDGWSKQAPKGMVKLTKEEFEPIVRAVVAQLI